MSEHYFSYRPSSTSKEYKVETELLGNHLTFYTDNGVFSKNGIDFGSRLLIESAKISNGDSILDLGCAYGTIGIAFAKALPISKVTMVEINERACELARNNVMRNSVEGNTEVLHGDGFEPISGRRFKHILLNPPIRAGKSLIYSLFEGAVQALYPDGVLWIVIRKQQGAGSARLFLQKSYESVEVVEKKKGFWIIRAKK